MPTGQLRSQCCCEILSESLLKCCVLYAHILFVCEYNSEPTIIIEPKQLTDFKHCLLFGARSGSALFLIKMMRWERASPTVFYEPKGGIRFARQCLGKLNVYWNSQQNCWRYFWIPIFARLIRLIIRSVNLIQIINEINYQLMIASVGALIRVYRQSPTGNTVYDGVLKGERFQSFVYQCEKPWSNLIIEVSKLHQVEPCWEMGALRLGRLSQIDYIHKSQ